MWLDGHQGDVWLLVWYGEVYMPPMSSVKMDMRSSMDMKASRTMVTSMTMRRVKMVAEMARLVASSARSLIQHTATAG